VFQAESMTQPLALVLYERLLPGTQVVNRLQDLHYRVQTVADAALLPESAEQAKPMLVLVDLSGTREKVCAAVSRLKGNPATRHLPVIGFGAEEPSAKRAAALPAGLTLMVSDAAILNHLSECLDRALQVE
jgi:CheY-like chemotaxis protein